MVFVNEVRPMSYASLAADQLQFHRIISESLIRVYSVLVFEYYDPDYQHYPWTLLGQPQFPQQTFGPSWTSWKVSLAPLVQPCPLVSSYDRYLTKQDKEHYPPPRVHEWLSYEKEKKH